jgi:hypothetical protein
VTNKVHLSWLETRFAAFVVERQQHHRTPAIVRIEANYGPAGIAFGAAAILFGLVGAFAACFGIVMLFVSGGSGTMSVVAYVLLFVAVSFEILAMVRATQGIYAGRRFRGDRPFAKGP